MSENLVSGSCDKTNKHFWVEAAMYKQKVHQADIQGVPQGRCFVTKMFGSSYLLHKKVHYNTNTQYFLKHLSLEPEFILGDHDNLSNK